MKTRNIGGFALAVGTLLARPMAAQDDAPCKFTSAPNDFGGLLRLRGPVEGDLARPFDTFWVGIDLSTPGTFASRIEERGILKGWELTDPSSAIRHVFGFSQEYEYLNNESQVFGAQILSMGLFSRYRLGSRLTAVTDASAIVMPLAGIRTVDFQTQDSSYDYAPVLPERRARSARRTDRRRSRLRLVQPEDELPRLFRAPQDAVGVAPVPRCILRISMNRPSPEGPAPRL